VLEQGRDSASKCREPKLKFKKAVIFKSSITETQFLATYCNFHCNQCMV